MYVLFLEDVQDMSREEKKNKIGYLDLACRIPEENLQCTSTFMLSHLNYMNLAYIKHYRKYHFSDDYAYFLYEYGLPEEW